MRAAAAALLGWLLSAESHLTLCVDLLDRSILKPYTVIVIIRISYQYHRVTIHVAYPFLAFLLVVGANLANFVVVGLSELSDASSEDHYQIHDAR